MTHRCYGCQQTFAYKNLDYECMCLHEEEPHYRGVCNECTKNKSTLDVEDDSNNHHLEKIHQYSDKNKQFWEDVNEKCPAWSGFYIHEDKLVVSYPNFPEGIRSWDELTEQQAHDIQYSVNGPRSRTTEFPITYDEFIQLNKCICCE